jgi:hypothetical protein
VYRTLLKECLADGWAQDFAGLFLCCREVHQELESEFMTRFRPLLTAKYEWETTSLQKTPLRLLVKPKPCRNMLKPELSVDISLLVLVVKRKVKMHDILPKLALCLRPVLALNWSVLTLSTKVHIRDSLRITSIFRGFFHTLDYRTKASSRYLQGVRPPRAELWQAWYRCHKKSFWGGALDVLPLGTTSRVYISHDP